MDGKAGKVTSATARMFLKLAERSDYFRHRVLLAKPIQTSRRLPVRQNRSSRWNHGQQKLGWTHGL